MSLNFFRHLLQLFKSRPGPEFVAQQLRKPSGEFAEKIGSKMNEANEPLYDLTADVMEVENDDRILEIGFGNGKFFDKLFVRSPELHITGIDYSEEMVAAAKKNNKEYMETGRLKILNGASNALPFSDNAFTKVFCNMVIYFWDNPQMHLREIYRVLETGGIFYTGFRTRESMLLFPFVKHGFTLYDTPEWSKILQQNGFSLLDVYKRSDPPIELEGKEVCLESCCIAAVKKTDKPL